MSRSRLRADGRGGGGERTRRRCWIQPCGGVGEEVVVPPSAGGAHRSAAFEVPSSRVGVAAVAGAVRPEVVQGKRRCRRQTRRRLRRSSPPRGSQQLLEAQTSQTTGGVQALGLRT